MSGICDTCRRMTCEYRADDIEVCGLPKTETNWERLFGTPERAAHTSWYMLMCEYVDCDECPISDGCDIATDVDCYNGEIALLEWLKGEGE